MHLSQTTWPATAVREWNSLNQESNPELYWEGMLSFGIRQEIAGNLESAASVYARFSTEESVPPQLRRRASERLESFQGHGTLGARSEFMLRNFVGTATDPASLVAMGVAGAVFQLGRATCLARMASAETSLITRGMFSRALASAGAFGLEAPAFAMTARLANDILGRPQDWSGRSIGRDLASSYLTLGGLRLTGWAGGSLYRRFAGNSSPSLGQHLYHQGGMLSGILLGHGLERWAGLRGQEGNSNIFLDSLATLLQFNVAGRLAHSTFGASIGNWERALEWRSEILSATSPILMATPTNFPDRIPVLAGTIATEGPAEFPPSEHAAVVISSHEGRTRTAAAQPSLDEVIRSLSKLVEASQAEDQIQAMLPEDFPRRISEWGDAFMERSRSAHIRFLPELMRLHEKIERGERLKANEHRRLRGFLRNIQAQLDDFHEDWEILRKAARLTAPRNEKGASERAPLKLVLHDLQYNAEPLVMAKLSLERLIRGDPLRPYQKIYLFAPGGGHSASGALKDGLARTSVETPEIFQRLGNDWHRTFLDELKFAQGHHPTKAAGDIVANLLTNAWRYRSSENPQIQMETESISGGGLRVTVKDDGIGILPEHLLDLGGNGFREARVAAPGSQGWGLASVIDNLRSLNWGPLWVRSRPGEMTQFRFEIPPEAFQGGSAPERLVDTHGQGPETALERNLTEGFTVPAASMDLAILQILQELPGVRNSMSLSGKAGPSGVRSLANGDTRNRRMESLHRLLSAGRNPSELSAAENGPGVLVDIATSLARLGTRIDVKEPDSLSGAIYQTILENDLPASVQEKIRIIPTNRLNAPSPADISYWANPDPSFLRRLSASNSEDYLGRDVKPGGFLVIQTDHHQTKDIHAGLPQLDTGRWLKVFDAPLPDLSTESNEIMPTGQGTNLYLQIFRRQ